MPIFRARARGNATAAPNTKYQRLVCGSDLFPMIGPSEYTGLSRFGEESFLGLGDDYATCGKGNPGVTSE
jgi:hypothetical protein